MVVGICYTRKLLGRTNPRLRLILMLRLHGVLYSMLQRREGEANAREKRSTFSNLLLVQGHI